jgi:hypothetical protein
MKVRARWAGRVPVGAEHDVLDDQLAAATEQPGELSRSLRGLEDVLLLDPDHRESAPLGIERVPPAGLLLLLSQQPQPGLKPLIA